MNNFCCSKKGLNNTSKTVNDFSQEIPALKKTILNRTIYRSTALSYLVTQQITKIQTTPKNLLKVDVLIGYQISISCVELLVFLKYTDVSSSSSSH